jgi:hypothetical protein
MPSQYQVQLVNATETYQNVLSNKQLQDSYSGDIANDLYQADLNASTTVLNADSAYIQTVTEQGSAGGWTQDDSNAYNAATELYQNDTIIAQTGQNNANTAVEQIQTQVSQDGTNLSNVISISNVLVQIGTYTSNLIGGGGYTVS